MRNNYIPSIYVLLTTFNTKLHAITVSTGIAVACSESIEHFPDMASKRFFKPLVAILLAPVITGIILHFMSHIHISIHKLLCLVSFSFPLRDILSAGIATSISMRLFFCLVRACKIAKSDCKFRHVCLSVRPFAWDNSVPTRWIIMKLDI
jgi:hypothetical protein